LKGEIYHFSYRDISDHIRTAVTLSKKMALERKQRRQSFLSLNLIFRPLWTFMRMYVLKLGMLDGYRGLIAAVISSFYTFCKYAFLYELSLKGVEPKDENS
jgi:hypothetical protein